MATQGAYFSRADNRLVLPDDTVLNLVINQTYVMQNISHYNLNVLIIPRQGRNQYRQFSRRRQAQLLAQPPSRLIKPMAFFKLRILKNEYAILWYPGSDVILEECRLVVGDAREFCPQDIYKQSDIGF